MPPSNRIIFASAGAGKTTEIVKEALAIIPNKVAITTYTQRNVAEIRKKIVEINGFIPSGLSVYPWFTFVFHELVRPFQGGLYDKRINGLHFATGATRTWVGKDNIEKYFFDSSGKIYSDRMSDFAIICNNAHNGSVIDRLSRMFSHIFVDEVQDLAGHDIDVLDLLLRSPINITMVGDVRQSTFRTSYAPKNKKFCGRGFVRKIEDWKKAGLCEIENRATSKRCVQPICDVADLIFPDLPKTRSTNERTTGHDGVFVVRSDHVQTYLKKFNPQVLRLDKRFGKDLAAENFGLVKGLGFERVLIVPYSGITKWIRTGDATFVSGSADEVYIGITRAHQSVAIIHDGSVAVPGIGLFDPEQTN